MRFGMLLLMLTTAVCAQPQAPRPISEHLSNGVVQIEVKPEITQREHAMKAEGASVYAPWRGILHVAIRNVSRNLVRLVEESWDIEYDFEVLDSSGASVPMTKEGETLLANKLNSIRPISGPVSQFTLGIQEECVVDINLAQMYQIAPGKAYKIRIFRSKGLPTVDESGKPLKDVELRCLIEIPDYGIAR